MIADNWATPRDVKLLSGIGKPIHIILCGAWYGINVDYINLALQSGGTVHTIDEDLTELAKVNEGETIEIMGKVFEMKGGRFIPVSPV